MKRQFSPVWLALILIVFCVSFRVISSTYTDFTFNISPLLAVAFVGAMYLPHRWGWLLAPISLVFTEVAFLRLNYLTDASGQFFSWWTVASVAFYAALYAAISGFGILAARFRSLGFLIGGSLVASLVFYLASNSFSWTYDVAIHMPNGYAPTLAGWWQANTVGLPGYPATWHFLRNGMLGDLFFAFVLLMVFDREMLFGHAPAKTAARTA
jgi:hypothetical protein